MNVTNKKLK